MINIQDLKDVYYKKKKPNNFLLGLLWYLQESNQGHKDFQSFALPTELRYQPLVGANLTFFSFKNYIQIENS